MAKKLVARIAADNQSSSVKECSSERCAWYVIAGRILMIFVVPLWIIFCISPFLYITVSIWDKVLRWNTVDYIFAHPLILLAIFVGMYLLFLIWYVYKLSRLVKSNLNGGE